MEPIRREDSDDLFEAVVSQDSVMRWLATGRVGSRSAATAMCADHVAHWTRHGYGDFAVRDAATHAFLGRVGLRNRAQHGVDLGFAVHPRAHGRGIAGEAGRACLNLARTPSRQSPTAGRWLPRDGYCGTWTSTDHRAAPRDWAVCWCSPPIEAAVSPGP